MGEPCIYSYRGFSRYLHSGRCCPIKISRKQNNVGEMVWVNRRYNPRDLRPNTPMSTSPLKNSLNQLPPSEWVRYRDPSGREVSRGVVEKSQRYSQPATRDESWSTLREMTPSLGRPFKHRPPSWGISGDVPPEIVSDPHIRFPRVQSSMSRHRDDEQYSYHNMPRIGLYAIKSALKGQSS